MLKPQLSATFLGLILSLTTGCLEQAHAAIDETFLINESVNADQIARWSALTGVRDYQVHFSDPDANDLELLNQLQGAGNITVEITNLPGEDSIDAWHALAQRGVDFVATGVPSLNDTDIDRLNRIGFKNCRFAFAYYPAPEDAQRLNHLKCHLDMGFIGNAYPKYAEIPGVNALPAGEVAFNIDFWPYYTQMDVLNLIPRDVSIWVRGMYPPADELDYLHHINHLKKITLETTFDPDSSKQWSEFGKIRVDWRSIDNVPALEQLNAFQQGGPERNFTLTTHRPLNSDELERLHNSPIPVRWIHEAP